MPTVPELEQAFKVYFDEIGRCQKHDLYWALLHVVVSLPDICAALEAGNAWATEKKYVDWCRRFAPHGMLTGEDYRDIRNLVLHQGRTRNEAGRFYKFTKPARDGGSAHRTRPSPDVIVLDVGELASEMVASIRAWFADLQGPAARERRAHVAKNLPSLVTVKTQALPGITASISTFSITGTSTGP